MSLQEIQARTIGGVCYISAADMAKSLRERADQIESAKPAVTELDDLVRTQEYTYAVAFDAIAKELRERADTLEFGVIELLTEQPGDSDLTGESVE